MNKVHSAESLRGLACLAVVFSHFFGTFFPQLHNFYGSNLPKFEFIELIYNSPFAFFYSGTGAVFVFFVLSGYVLTLSFLKSKDSKRKLKESLIKRYPRLAIPAIFSCLLMWVVLHFSVDLENVSEWFRSVGAKTPNLLEAIYSGAIGSFIFGEAKYNPVLWTMQIELLGSLIVYLICFFQKNNIIKYALVVISILASMSLSFMAFLGILSFILGHFLYFFSRRIPEFICIFLFIVGLYFCGAHNESASYTVFSKILGERTYNILNFFGGGLIVFASIKSNIIDNFFNKNILLSLGKLSFSIYLVHIPIMYILGVPIFNIFLNEGFNFVASALISIFISLLFTIALSVFYSRYIDDFAIKFSNSLSKLILKKNKIFEKSL
ncbi:acyltransferase [Acinetobacter oleivorans]|uniref:acyltransferase family protein n=1 Tax=Acinetobacter oleivorans TaxID=1148157 RepID=UPI00178CBAF6|nr:acyltransferase [Acinetobacter oleivorans]MBE2173384.1 acyltransferase [Acinetobacter oleivorans]MDY7374479.1 acyltransferase [Acinetobacter oleivorans]